MACERNPRASAPDDRFPRLAGAHLPHARLEILADYEGLPHRLKCSKRVKHWFGGSRTPRRPRPAKTPWKGGMGGNTRSISARTVLGTLGLAAALLALIQATPGKWGDMLTDYGREVYLAWQLSEGKTLYKDVAHYFGPVSSLFNSLVFTLSTRQIQALQTVNALIAALTCLLVHLFTRKTAGTVAALANAGVFLVFAATSLGEGTASNHNFISPYSHELTHGLLLGYLYFNTVNLDSPAIGRNGFACGILLSLTFHTKSEVFAALACACAAHALHAALFRGTRPRVILAFASSLCAAFALVSICLAAWFARSMDLRQYLSGILLMYQLPFHIPLPMKHYYAQRSGLEDIAGNLMMSAKAMLFVIAFHASAILSNLLISRAGTPRRNETALSAAAILLLCVPAFVTIYFHTSFTITYFLPSWLMMAIATALLARRTGGEVRANASLVFSHHIFALVMLGKIFFKPSTSSYSTFLLLPTLYSFTISSHILFNNTKKSILLKNLSIVTVSILFLCIYNKMTRTASHLFSASGITHDWERGSFTVSGNKLPVLRDSIAYIETRKGAGDTLAVFPEGGNINYLLNMPNPTRHINVSPPEWFTFGGRAITEEYESSPPTWIISYTRDNALYGFGGLCNYAPSLCALLEERYDLVLTAVEPYSSGKSAFGARVYRLRTSPAATTPRTDAARP